MSSQLSQIKNLILKNDTAEFRIHMEQVICDDLLPVKLSVFAKALSIMATLGIIKYVVFNDPSTLDKVIKVRRL